jgi:hypothetical protein
MPVPRTQPSTLRVARPLSRPLAPSVPPNLVPRPMPAGLPRRMPGPLRPLPLPRGQQVPSQRLPAAPNARAAFGLPNLRRNVCPHFYMTGARGAIPIQAPHLLKGLLRQPNNISRCQLRGGVHLDDGFVNDVCLTPRFNQCVFYEDELTRE